MRWPSTLLRVPHKEASHATAFPVVTNWGLDGKRVTTPPSANDFGSFLLILESFHNKLTMTQPSMVWRERYRLGSTWYVCFLRWPSNYTLRSSMRLAGPFRYSVNAHSLFAESHGKLMEVAVRFHSSRSVVYSWVVTFLSGTLEIAGRRPMPASGTPPFFF
jgi:hypothetical protein